MATEMKMVPFGVGRRMCPAITVSLLHISYFVANLVRERVGRRLCHAISVSLLHISYFISYFMPSSSRRTPASCFF
jgi:hypothetical protein